jgi:hypothetical protein
MLQNVTLNILVQNLTEVTNTITPPSLINKTKNAVNALNVSKHLAQAKVFRAVDAI